MSSYQSLEGDRADDEQRLWKRINEKYEVGDLIRIMKEGQQLGIGYQRTGDLARRWKNEGRVDFSSPPRMWLLPQDD